MHNDARAHIIAKLAAAFLGCSVAVVCLLLSFGEQEDAYSGYRIAERRWAVNDSPQVVCYLFAGEITVIQGVSDEITLICEMHAVSTASQAAADAALKTISVFAEQVKNRIDVRVDSPAARTLLALGARVELHVPSNVRLDLTAKEGAIRVGGAYRATKWMDEPVLVRSIKASALGAGTSLRLKLARRDAGAGESDILPVMLDLECNQGIIDIVADDVLIKASTYVESIEKTARCGHGPSKESRGDRGSIRYRGHLAPGAHYFQAANDIHMSFPPGMQYCLESKADVGGVAPVNLSNAAPTPCDDQDRDPAVARLNISTFNGIFVVDDSLSGQ